MFYISNCGSIYELYECKISAYHPSRMIIYSLYTCMSLDSRAHMILHLLSIKHDT